MTVPPAHAGTALKCLQLSVISTISPSCRQPHFSGSVTIPCSFQKSFIWLTLSGFRISKVGIRLGFFKLNGTDIDWVGAGFFVNELLSKWEISSKS